MALENDFVYLSSFYDCLRTCGRPVSTRLLLRWLTCDIDRRPINPPGTQPRHMLASRRPQSVTSTTGCGASKLTARVGIPFDWCSGRPTHVCIPTLSNPWILVRLIDNQYRGQLADRPERPKEYSAKPGRLDLVKVTLINVFRCPRLKTLISSKPCLLSSSLETLVTGRQVPGLAAEAICVTAFFSPVVTTVDLETTTPYLSTQRLRSKGFYSSSQDIVALSADNSCVMSLPE